ncbi:hypothetical protein DFH08DRAFT_44979 [Mycena albidolilacea]|uniref:Uncharacterized protein n=1 Tax=Mycena albidolilacea TaxID=1033008 RepID=A0AAD7ABR4_9AGAR|nr:hypothetical protein DFH08DRAFT_44979 [Mycena albidolilacea]
MGHTAVHVLSAVNIAVHAPSSRTSLRAPSALCAARRTPSAPSASPRMSLYRARRRARPPPCIHPAHVLRIPHLAAYLPRGVHGAEHVPHIVHKGVHDSRFAHAPRHVAVHLPSVVVHGSGFVLVAAHVPRVYCIAAHVPRRRVRLRPGYTVGVLVLIAHRTARVQCAHAASRGCSPVSYEHQQRVQHLYVVIKYYLLSTFTPPTCFCLNPHIKVLAYDR